jgi:hypothetical protein
MAITGSVGRPIVLERARKYKSDLPDEVNQEIYALPKRKFEDGFAPALAHLLDPRLVDLMTSLLAPRLEDRITTDAALAHPFFTEQDT